MTIDRKKFEWNLNTIIQLVTLAGMIIGGVALWVNQSRDIEDLQKWRDAHEQMGKERYAEVQASKAKIEEVQRGLQTDVSGLQRKSDNVDYRITVLETSLAAQQQQQQKFGEDMSEMKGDMKVIKEAVLRLDSANKRLGR